MSTATAPPQETTTGRDRNGRFTKGNPGGTGNLFTRQVAELRKRLLEHLTGEALDAIADKLIDQAKEGDVPAIKLLFTYTLGKPADAVQPDQLDIEEWETFKKTATMAGELPGIMATPDPSFPLAMVRAARPGVARDLAKDLQATLKAGEEEQHQRQQRREQRRQRRRQRREQRRAERLGRSQRQEQPGQKANGSAAPPASPLDVEARHCLETLAEHDSQALSVLSTTGQDCPPVAQAPPSPNGCGKRHDRKPIGNDQQPAPDSAAPSTNGQRRSWHGLGRFWPFGKRG
jgi:hypothetical protein